MEGIREAPDELRRRIRKGEFSRHTAGRALGFVQANLVVLPRGPTADVLRCCQRNPKPCPLLAMAGLLIAFPTLALYLPAVLY